MEIELPMVDVLVSVAWESWDSGAVAPELVGLPVMLCVWFWALLAGVEVSAAGLVVLGCALVVEG